MELIRLAPKALFAMVMESVKSKEHGAGKLIFTAGVLKAIRGGKTVVTLKMLPVKVFNHTRCPDLEPMRKKVTGPVVRMQSSKS